MSSSCKNILNSDEFSWPTSLGTAIIDPSHPIAQGPVLVGTNLYCLFSRRSLRMTALMRNSWECGHGLCHLWDQRLIMIMGGMNIQLVPTIGSDAPIYNFQLGMIATFMESMCSRWPCHFHAGDGEVCVSSPNLRLQETARRRDGRCPQGAARWCQNGMYKGTFYQFIIP